MGGILKDLLPNVSKAVTGWCAVAMNNVMYVMKNIAAVIRKILTFDAETFDLDDRIEMWLSE